MTDAAAPPIAGPIPDGMPDANLNPPQIARGGDPFAALRMVVFLSSVTRNVTHQLRDVAVALNAAYLDWAFSEKVLLAEVVQLQSNWSVSYHGEDRIVLDRNERGHTLMIVDSSKMSSFLAAEARRLVRECEAELRSFAVDEGHGPDW